MRMHAASTSKFVTFTYSVFIQLSHDHKLPFFMNPINLSVGWHPKPLWVEAEAKCGAGGLIPTHPVSEEGGPAEGPTVGGVWRRKRSGLWWRGQGVVLPHVQGDVQPILRTVWVFCHVSPNTASSYASSTLIFHIHILYIMYCIAALPFTFRIAHVLELWLVWRNSK